MGINITGSDGTLYKNLVVSGHAKKRMRERNMGYHEVTQGIKNGRYGGTDHKDNNVYILELPVDLIIHVDPEKEKIVTVYYDDGQGAEGGRL